MQRQYVRFQMKNSTRPQTIAEVFREVDIQSFRSNPEWYEIMESTPIKEVVTRKRKFKGTENGNQKED